MLRDCLLHDIDKAGVFARLHLHEDLCQSGAALVGMAACVEAAKKSTLHVSKG